MVKFTVGTPSISTRANGQILPRHRKSGLGLITSQFYIGESLSENRARIESRSAWRGWQRNAWLHYNCYLQVAQLMTICERMSSFGGDPSVSTRVTCHNLPSLRQNGLGYSTGLFSKPSLYTKRESNWDILRPKTEVLSTYARRQKSSLVASLGKTAIQLPRTTFDFPSL